MLDVVVAVHLPPFSLINADSHHHYSISSIQFNLILPLSSINSPPKIEHLQKRHLSFEAEQAKKQLFLSCAGKTLQDPHFQSSSGIFLFSIQLCLINKNYNPKLRLNAAFRFH